MDEYQNFYVQKSPQSFDETLVTYGLATVIHHLSGVDSGIDIIITDKGAYYDLTLNMPLAEEMIVAGSRYMMPRKALATNKTKLPTGIDSDHYETIRDQVNSFYEARKKGNEDVAFPSEPWDVYRAINPASLPGYNGLMTDWFTVRDTPEALIILLDLYAELPNDVDTAIERWKALNKEQNWNIKQEATRQSLYNPDSGKGQNKSKADGLSISNVKSFWLTEWLKAVGFYEVALTKQLKGVKDRKTLVLAPRQFAFEQHQKVMEDFRETMQASETSIRFDLFASIRYTDVLLRHYVEHIAKRRRISNPKKELVAGFHTAFYKDMGNAVATMNLSFIALPGWVTIDSAEDVSIYRAILNELEQVVRQFDEGHSDDMILLQHLRDSLSGDELSPFLEFTTGYAEYFMRTKEKKPFLKLLDTKLVERIVNKVGKTYADIADREKYPGFHNIARAISESTVIAQWRSPKNKTYEIRYGLHRDLARQAQTWEKFVSAVSEFIYTYNAETSRAQELGKSPWRPMIEANDIADLLRMKDDYEDSKMVAQLLIAFGSTFLLPKKENSQENE